MPLMIYNSLHKEKRAFAPFLKGKEGRKVRMYVCGPTVYDEPHIGHLRSAYIFTIVKRYLEYACHYSVDMVRNITDVDDKIIEKARMLNNSDLEKAAETVSDNYYKMYQQALKELGINDYIEEPMASKHIPDMVKLIQRLIDNEYAYEKEGDVYFIVERFSEYGNLSGQKKDQMLEGVRIDPSEHKNNPLDFALWKKAKDKEPAWDIELTIRTEEKKNETKKLRGRPGWHIECSAMSGKYLGEFYDNDLPFDIHGGGRDLIFPHHENEIAQTKAATGRDLARFWMHHGLITINGQKMSKSLNNFLTLEDIRRLPAMQPWGIETLKFLFLGTHYRAPLDYTGDRMRMEHAIFRKFYYFFEEAADHKKEGCTPLKDEKIDDLLSKFHKAMSDDFNTPLAMSSLIEAIHYSHKTADSQVLLYAAQEVDKILQQIFCMESLLQFFEIKDRINMPQELRNPAKEQLEQDIKLLIQRRKDARAKKDFNISDELRRQLLEKGSKLYDSQVELVDLKDGNMRLRPKV